MQQTFIVILLLTASTICKAQSICEQLSSLKQKCYGFKPTELSSKQKDEKSKQMDEFWNLAKTNKSEAAPCIRDMILSEKNDPYFCFDAASLLLEIDDHQQYLDAVLEGVKKCRLRDLDLEPYLRISCFLAANHKDVSELADKLISEPNATVYLTEHVIRLSAVDASLFIYNLMGTENAEASLFKTLSSGNPTGINNAAIVLNIISTEKGDSLLNRMIVNKNLADSTIKSILKDRKLFSTDAECVAVDSRDGVLTHLKAFPAGPGNVDSEIAGNDQLICSACKNLKPEDVPIIRAARDRCMRGLSDESLYDYFALTKILMSVRGVSNNK